MSALPGRGSAIVSSLRSGAAAPVVVLALLAMVIVPLAPIVLDRPGRQDLIDQLAEEPDWVRSFQDRNSAVFRRASQRGEP